MTLASNVASSGVAQALDVSAGLSTGSSTIVAEKIVREGLYRDYEVDIKQEVDDARSTFKAAKETKSKKGEYEIFDFRVIILWLYHKCKFKAIGAADTHIH